jgi:hypothetical protein
MDRFILSGCYFLQFADDKIVYFSHHIFEIARTLVQTACSSLRVFFSMIGLTISATNCKSEVVLFSRKQWLPVDSIRVNGRLLPQSISFKYPRVFYDTGLRWRTQAKYVQKRCLQRLNFLKSIAGVWWGAHPRYMVLLYKGLINSVLDYVSVCYSGMAKTHMLRLERVQYHGIRLALGLMCSTPKNSLGFLSGIPSLPERFVYLNSRYLVAVFYRLGHPLREKLKDLRTMNMSRCIQGYSNVLSMDIIPPESFTRHELSAFLGTPLVNVHWLGFRIPTGGSRRALSGGMGVCWIGGLLYGLIEGSAEFASHQTWV